MEGSDVLLAICEVSIAFAGFTSIVGVLGQRGGGHWDAEDTFRLWLMIESSLATLFFSLLPFSLHYFALVDTTVWGVSSGAMATFMLVHMIVVSPKVRALDRSGSWSTRRFEPLIGGFIIATLLVQSLNVLDLGFHRSFGAYLLGLILFLGLASMHFVALLVAVHSSNLRDRD
ncbi:MAG: hypothetical protein JRE71_06820 [Deltaproteobacteria bacterium]|nr:hypothetical protein [Deltaproteobacteria bacterium]